MATKSMGYDSPAYLAVHQDNLGSIAAAASSASPRFVAMAAAILKSVTLRIQTAPAAGDAINVFQLSGTTTTTYAAGTIGSGATGFVNFALATQPVLAQGDAYWVAKGTDTVGTYTAVAIERVIQPLANVTV